MSPSIDITPDLLGILKPQVSPVPTSTAMDLETLCAALDLLQTGGQADLNALGNCLLHLSCWLKKQEEADRDDVSGWTSEPLNVKGIGGMITCYSDQLEVIFNLDASGQPYMGMWQSILPGEPPCYGSFKIQAGDRGTQLILEGSRPLQVLLPVFGTVDWGAMDAFYQGLNNSRQQNIPAVELSPDAPLTILVEPAKHQTSPVPLLSENSGRKTAPAEQPTMISPKTWKCACGSMNTGEFCTRCGGKKPAPVVEQKSTPAQLAFCRQCGSALSIGARFCCNCGTEVRS